MYNNVCNLIIVSYSKEVDTMNLEKKIEIIREKLNNMLKNEDKLTRTSIINVSQELDKLIVEYYNNAK